MYFVLMLVEYIFMQAFKSILDDVALVHNVYSNYLRDIISGIICVTAFQDQPGLAHGIKGNQEVEAIPLW